MSKITCCRPVLSWHMLPIFMGITAFLGMIVTYILAKQNCHIEKWYLPYISYTGTEHPESSVFGLILNTEGFLGIIVVTIAWRYMRHVRHGSHLNSAALVSGILSCFGVIMVGNFQVSKNKVPHYIGAGLAFIVGTIYCALSSILTHKLQKKLGKKTMCGSIVCVTRFTATSIMVISIVVLMSVGLMRINYNEKLRQKDPGSEKLEYEFRFPNGSCVPVINRVPEYKRYLDLVGSCMEWLLTICLLLGLSLYAYEFKAFHCIKIVLKREGTELSLSLLQINATSPNAPITSLSVVSPNSSLPRSSSDTSILIEKHPHHNNCIVKLHDGHRNNNNFSSRNSWDQCTEISSQISKSMPNMSSSDVDEV